MFTYTCLLIRCLLTLTLIAIIPACFAFQSRSLIRNTPSLPVNSNVTANNNLSAANHTTPMAYPASNGSSTQETPTPTVSKKFPPSTALMLIILVAALMSVGFLSVYLQQQCTLNTETNTFPLRSVISHGRSSLNGTSSYSAMLSRLALGSRSLSSLPSLRFSKTRNLGEPGGRTSKDLPAECVVCLSSFQEGEEIRLLPNCGHFFHQCCIDMWLFSHVTCPLCRTSILHLRNSLSASQRKSRKWFYFANVKHFQQPKDVFSLPSTRGRCRI